MGLGLIPAWQFSMDPQINYKINPFVTYPDGVYQTTPQPLYPYYQGPEGGLGYSDFSSIWSNVGSSIRDKLNAELAKRQADRLANKGGPDQINGLNGASTAGPRVTLMGASPVQLMGLQLLGRKVRRQRTLMGIGLGLGAVALLGKLLGR